MHEPCASRGDCHHARGGRSKSTKKLAQLVQASKRAKETWIGSSEHKAQLFHLNNSPEHSAQLTRIHEIYLGSPKNKVALARATKRTQETWINSPGHKAQLARLHNSPEHKAHIISLGRKNVESGHLARISKGVPSTADGILFRSQMEASFYCVFQELGGEPIYEPNAIELSDGTSYHPDFVLGKSVLDILANKPIELKFSRNAYYNGNVEKAIRAGAIVIYWDELLENQR